MAKIEDVMLKLAIALNNRKINWGLGGSYLLMLHNLVGKVRDIDFVIDPLDELKVLELLEEYNIPYTTKSKEGIYGTRQLVYFIYEEVEVDFLIGFIVKDFVFPTGKFLAPISKSIKGVDVHLCDLKDWLYAYQLMERNDKVSILEEYFKNR